MTDTSPLLAVIEARLAEDEQWALAASQPYQYAAEGATIPPGGVHWTWVVGEDWTPVTVDPAVDDTVGGPEQYGCPVNIASVERWDCPPWTMADGSTLPNDRTMPRVVANQMVEVDSSAAGHMVRHDPARVLREIAAKRTLLARHSEHVTPGWDCDFLSCGHDWRTRSEKTPGVCRDCEEDYPAMGCVPLLVLAAPYSDHPDYQPEWSPPNSVVPTS